MGLGKKDIVKNISTKTHLSSKDSKKVLDSFINLLIKNKNIKLSNFGSFTNYVSPERIGRNPATKKEFIISKRNKPSFKPSSKIRKTIN